MHAGVRMCVRTRREQGEQSDGDEIAERGLRPANFGSTVEPGRVDEEDDARDHDLAEPRDDEEERRENDPPERQLRQADGGCEVEHIPCEPEDQRAEQDSRGERRKHNGKPAGDEGADPEDSQHDSKDQAHAPSV